MKWGHEEEHRQSKLLFFESEKPNVRGTPFAKCYFDNFSSAWIMFF